LPAVSILALKNSDLLGYFCKIVLLTWLLQTLNLTDRINFNPSLSIRFGPSFARKTPWFCKAATA
jgi:hypothetical protein